MSLPTTSPWFTTCISRGLWNGCGRLPPQPQPLSPSIVCLGENHHQWVWESHLNRRNRRSPWAEGDRLGNPHPNGNPHTDPPWMDTPTALTPAPAYHAKDTSIREYMHISPRVIPVTLSDKCLLLQEKMNMALEQLLTVRSSRDLCYKELDLNMKLAAHLNKVQTTKVIRQAKSYGTTMAYTLQKAHLESILVLEHQAT